MERTESFGLRNTFQQARQSEFIKLKSGMLNTVEVYYSANYQNRREPVFFNCRQSRFVRRLAVCPQQTGLRLGHLNSPRSPALSLLIKVFPRACRQKQPERRLFLLSASPHPPITKTGESRFFLIVVRAVSSVALRLVLNGRDYGLGI